MAQRPITNLVEILTCSCVILSMATTETRTDLSIDSEGTVYRDVGGKFVRVSWLSTSGLNRKYNTSIDGISDPEMGEAVTHLVNQWEAMKNLSKLAEQYDLEEEGVTLEELSEAMFTAMAADLIPKNSFIALINRISSTAFLRGVNATVEKHPEIAG